MHMAVGAPQHLFPPAPICCLSLQWLLMLELIIYNSDTSGSAAWRRTSTSPRWFLMEAVLEMRTYSRVAPLLGVAGSHQRTSAILRLAVPYSLFAGNPSCTHFSSLVFVCFKHVFLLSCQHQVSGSNKHHSWKGLLWWSRQYTVPQGLISLDPSNHGCSFSSAEAMHDDEMTKHSSWHHSGTNLCTLQWCHLASMLLVYWEHRSTNSFSCPYGFSNKS